MSDKVFLDTNIWVYFFAKDPPEKAERISAVIRTQIPPLIISTQVLGELYNVLTRKRIFSATETQSIVSGLANRTTTAEIDTPKVLQAMEINIRYGYSYWDSLIVATALQSGCSTLYSEDMQHNQLIEGKLRIINPLM
ncbi:MAG: PIN domain-containing protein [Cyanobacteria bacterium J06659_2]